MEASPSSSPTTSASAVVIGQATISVLAAVDSLVSALAERQLHLTTVESCTGGVLAGLITSVPGASDVLMDSFVTYSNEAKVELGVPKDIIDTYTVYSSQTAVAMARTGLKRSVRANIGVGVTGSLTRVDPANSEASTPGEVYLGVAIGNKTLSKKLFVAEQHRYLAKLLVAQEIVTELLLLLEDESVAPTPHR